MLAADSVRHGMADAPRYARARRSARLVEQWEDAESVRCRRRGLQRDLHMAENARWVLTQLPAGAKMVVWAHNAHVANRPDGMGGHLRQTLGDAYVAAGFAFGGGAFNAVDASGEPREVSTALVPPGSFEAYFGAVGVPQFVLDVRRIAAAPPAAPLAAPLRLRSVGSTFIAGRDDAAYAPAHLTREFDLMIYVARTSASTLLPFPRR
jgi:erythromycin esterase